MRARVSGARSVVTGASSAPGSRTTSPFAARPDSRRILVSCPARRAPYQRRARASNAILAAAQPLNLW